MLPRLAMVLALAVILVIGCSGSSTKRTPTAIAVLASPTTGPTSTPQPTMTPTPPTLVVGNTDGDGVWLRRSPAMGDRLKAWPDGSVMVAIGEDQEAEGKTWKRVKDPSGNEGWIPVEYLVVATPTPTPQPAIVKPLDDALANIAQNTFGKRYKSSEVGRVNRTEIEAAFAGRLAGANMPTPKPGDKIITYAFVNVDLGTQWDEGTSVRSATKDFVKIAPQALSLGTIDVLEYRSFTEFTDQFGNPKYDVAFRFRISRSVAAKINWPNFDSRNLWRVLGDTDVDTFYIHPALRKAWFDFTKE